MSDFNFNFLKDDNAVMFKQSTNSVEQTKVENYNDSVGDQYWVRLAHYQG